MGWTNGKGLGKNLQGRVEPVPIELKEDHMGLGRWTMELEQAQDATEKRKLLEAEKEITEDLLQQYEDQAEKDKKLTETLVEMHKAFYCELCDRQYIKYSEYDNHINSYSHHHQQRLRDLKTYEAGRKFGGHRDREGEREKTRAAHQVAMERARMIARRKAKGGFTPAFTPVGQETTNQNGPPTTRGRATTSRVSRREAEESQAKIAAKKAKLNMFGLKFRSAGTLTSITDQLGTTVSTYKPPAIIQRLTGGTKEENDDSDSTKKISFGIQPTISKKTLTFTPPQSSQEKQYTSVWNTPGDGKKEPNLEPVTKGPPPKLMSRQRELNMEKAFGGDSSDEDELTIVPIKRGPTKFKFNFTK
ncbi:G patch domain-containing protein 8-like isoform X2 [Halichondria panicea]